MIKAARSFLDLVEEVVEDPDRISEAASSVADMVRSGLSKQEQPWERSAWAEPEPDSEPESAEAHGSAEANEPAEAHEPEVVPPKQRTPPSSRVRRITVD